MNPSRWCSTCATSRDSLMTLSPLLSTYDSVRGPVLRGLPQLLDPLLVIGLRVDIDPPDHTGMPWTAQFSAGQLITPRLCGLEPHLDFTPWDGVLFQPERRDKEAVDNIFAAQVHTHDLIQRYMELFVGFVVGCIKQAIWTGIGESPAKLLGGNPYLDIRRRALALDVGPGRFAHKPDTHEHNRWNDRPDQLQRCVAMRVGGSACIPFPVVVSVEEHHH